MATVVLKSGLLAQPWRRIWLGLGLLGLRQGCVVDVACVRIEHPNGTRSISTGMRVGDGGALGGCGGTGGVHHRHEIDMTRPPIA